MIHLRKKQKSTLVYFISETHFFSKDYSVLVVNLVGMINGDTASALQDCQEQILKSTAKWVILNFRDISSQHDSSTITALASLKNSICQRPVVLKFAGVHPDLQKTMLDEKLIAEEDVFNNLAEALRSTTPVASVKEIA